MLDGTTPEGAQSPISENNPKMFMKWTEQEIIQFVDPFSFDNFEILEPKEGQKEGYVKVKIPETAEPMVKGLIRAHLDLVEAFDAPLEKDSQEKLSTFIGDTTNAVTASEAQEAEWIETFGTFVDVASMMAGKPDPALEVLRSQSRQLAHDAVARELAMILGVANAASWDNFMDEQREKYKTPEDLPKEAEKAIIAKYEDYQKITTLIKGNPEAGQSPRFVLVNPQGKEMFRSISDLSHF